MIVDVGLYVDGKRLENDSSISEQVKLAEKLNGYVWVGLAEPTHEEFDRIVGELNFHPLAVEDAISARQRPKIEDYAGLTFFVIKTVFYDEKTFQVTTGELLCFIDNHFIVIVRHGSGSPLTTVRHDFEEHPDQVQLGPYAVLHAVIDRVVDGYTSIATALESDVIEIEAQVFGEKRETYSQEIYFLKREIIEYRHAIEPLLAPLQKLAGDNSPTVPDAIKPFMRDTIDHLQHACEHANGMDTLLTTVLQADVAHLQVRQNEDMRRISAWVALAAGPTMVAGIYGMNFQHMPELGWQYGYEIVITAMALLSSILFYKFKKSRWL